MIDIQTIQNLREETGCGMMDCKKAIEEAQGDFEEAKNILRIEGKRIAAKKQERKTSEGQIGVYLHSNGKVAAFVSLVCETDFVAKTKDFQNLAHDLAMQVAAVNPLYLDPENVPKDVLGKEKETIRKELTVQGKPKEMIERIMTGKLNKFFEETCLLKQPFIKDDKKKIEEVIQGEIAKLGENIKIKEFKRIMI